MAGHPEIQLTKPLGLTGLFEGFSLDPIGDRYAVRKPEDPTRVFALLVKPLPILHLTFSVDNPRVYRVTNLPPLRIVVYLVFNVLEFPPVFIRSRLLHFHGVLDVSNVFRMLRDEKSARC